MEKHFIRVKGLDICYRKSGVGPLLILLHPSPRSSKMMEPLMNYLSGSFTCVAPDTPGYGFSSPLPEKPVSLYDYIPFLHAFIQQLSDKPVYLYGTATGAQLAIAYSLIHPKNVGHVFADNCAHFDEKDCEAIVQNYFPDFTPAADGSHLQKIWQHVCDSCLYFPWYDKKEENRIADKLPPAAVIQEIVNDYLLAGPDYALAYKMAFLHERADKLQQLTVPATIFKWAGSPIFKQMERLLGHPLPACVSIVPTPVNVNERYKTMKETMFSIFIKNQNAHYTTL